MKYQEVETDARQEIEYDLRIQATRKVKEKLIEIDLAKKALAVMEEQFGVLMEKDVELKSCGLAHGYGGTVFLNGIPCGEMKEWTTNANL